MSGLTSDVERFKTNTYMYMTYLAYTVVLTCIKQSMPCNLHACMSYTTCTAHFYNMHFALTVTCMSSQHALHMATIFMLQACSDKHAC